LNLKILKRYNVIIVDLNQIILSNLLADGSVSKGHKIDENMVRHMILNTIRSFKVKFGQEYGELIIATDNSNYWRKQYFPYYKANRKKSQEQSKVDWSHVYEVLNKIRQEIKDYLPYRVIDIESAEADDSIGTLCHHFGTDLNMGEQILIISGDKDFIQLQVYANVKQWDPIRKRWLSHNDPKRFLMEHIIKGDAGDGVPNILSPDNCFMVGERQKAITAKRMEKYLALFPSQMEAPANRNYFRNETLIDLAKVPEEIKQKVMASYNEQEGKDKSKMLNYFIEYKLRNLTECIGEF